MSKTTITIELDLGPGYEQDPETGEFYPTDRESFDEQILSRVADEFARRLDYTGRARLDKIVSAKADAVIEERLAAEVAAVLARPLRKYDYDGEPKGEPFTINELVVQAVQKFASQPAGRTDGYSSSRGKVPGNLSELVDEAVKEALSKELAKDVTAARQAVAAEIKDRLSGAAADAIAKGR